MLYTYDPAWFPMLHYLDDHLLCRRVRRLRRHPVHQTLPHLRLYHALQLAESRFLEAMVLGGKLVPIPGQVLRRSL